MGNTVLDARYRADSLAALRADTREAVPFLRKEIRPIWENVLMSIEYGQSLRGKEPLIDLLTVEMVQIIMATYGCPRWAIVGFVQAFKKNILQYA